MRSYLPAYDMRVPLELDEALEIMAREPGEWKPFAGGTDIMVLLEQGKLADRRFLSVARLKGLRGFALTDDHVTLGAMITYRQVQMTAVLKEEFPLLCRAAYETGGIATQNRGTLGGNIANASPAADSPPALLVYDAELELVSASGRRWVPYADFHLGYKRVDMRPDELIRNIRLPRAKKNWRQYYRKVGTRRAQAISKVCFAGAALFEDGRIRDVRIALGSVAPTPLRCRKTEVLLRDQLTREMIRGAGEELAREIEPIDDFRSTARFRARVAQKLLDEFLLSLMTPAGDPA
ncbi:MAG TPA: xanthine dehydrogenase family protein subunit M [Terriglobales bacterium]|nr:xanthine dehydrogenase family protein subunit M [Terriglobales bacterium]